jgi:hypothetical protein
MRSSIVTFGVERDQALPLRRAFGMLPGVAAIIRLDQSNDEARKEREGPRGRSASRQREEADARSTMPATQ